MCCPIAWPDSNTDTLQQIIAGFKDIVSTATEANTAMQGTPEINGAKAGQEIADAFREVCIRLSAFKLVAILNLYSSSV